MPAGRGRIWQPLGLLVAAVMFLLVGLVVSADEPRPYHLSVRVVRGEEPGSERLRESLQEILITEIEQSECYLSVRAFEAGSEPPEPSLVLAVSGRATKEELEYEQSMDQQIKSQNPDDELLRVAVLQIDVAFVLQLADARTPVKWNRFRPTIRRRPQFRGEDPQEAARQQALYDIARKGKSFACSDSARKLERLVEKARRQAVPVR